MCVTLQRLHVLIKDQLAEHGLKFASRFPRQIYLCNNLKGASNFVCIVKNWEAAKLSKDFFFNKIIIIIKGTLQLLAV